MLRGIVANCATLVEDVMALRQETQHENAALKQTVAAQQRQIDALSQAQHQQSEEIAMLLKNQRAHQALLVPDNTGSAIGTPTFQRHSDTDSDAF